MTSGIISVCSALGSTVDTCFCQSTRFWGVLHIFHVNVNSGSEGTSWLSLSTETGLHSANCAADREDLTGTVLGLIVDAPVVTATGAVVQTVQNSVEIPHLQFGEQVADVPVMLGVAGSPGVRLPGDLPP